jgi:thioredoxin-like negative regulator of GroEL
VVGLCAAWCGTCREFQDTFKALQQRHPERSFVWLDVEDDAAIAGDIDVENFPSLVVFKRGAPVFFGVTQPQQGVVERLILALDDAPEALPLKKSYAAGSRSSRALANSRATNGCRSSSDSPTPMK